MATGQTLPDDTRQALREWAEGVGCRLLVLFGSRTSDEAVGVKGDVDLALLVTPLPSPPGRLSMIGELQDRVGRPRADVVFLSPDTDPVLRFEIFRTGVPLFEAHEGLFVDEVVRALALYEDALPFRRRLRESLTEGRAGHRDGSS